MSVSILVVDDEPDVAEMFRQRFRREARNGTYVLHFAYSGEEALDNRHLPQPHEWSARHSRKLLGGGAGRPQHLLD